MASAHDEATAADVESARPTPLSQAEVRLAVGDTKRALDLLSEFIRGELEQEAFESAAPPGASLATPAAAATSRQHLVEAFVLRSRVHFLQATRELTASAASSELAPRLGHDPTVECELAIEDADAAIARAPITHAAHILRAEAAAAAVPHRLRALLVDSMRLFPDDEQLQHMLATKTQGRASRPFQQQRSTQRRSADAGTADASSPTAAAPTAEEEADEVPPELECSLCYKLLLEPVTTPCGHTLCRHCLIAALDYGSQSAAKQACPLCRAPLHISGRDHHPTLALKSLIETYFPEALRRRMEEHREELQAAGAAATAAGGSSASVDGTGAGTSTSAAANAERVLPLFVLQPAFPGHALPLQIFEPRYRLLFRRVLQGSQCFGLVSYPPRGTDGGADEPPFSLVGTEMKVVQSSALPDGRLLVNCVALSRFFVRRHWEVDGYRVGAVVGLHDDPLPAPLAVGETDDMLGAEEMIDLAQRLVDVVATRTTQKIPPQLVRGVTAATLEFASLFLIPFFVSAYTELIGLLSTTSTPRRMARLKASASRLGLA